MSIERSVIGLALVLFVWTNDSRAEIVQFQMTGTMQVSDPSFASSANILTGAPATSAIASDNGITVLGPTPYLSRADSPFPVNGSSAQFFLEDFEPAPGCVPGDLSFCGGGKFSPKGARLLNGGAARGDSVDGDDGAIDGVGTNGASG